MSDGVSETAPAFDPGVTAKLFMHGGSQAVRLPKAFRFEGSEVSVRREGDKVILEPVKAPRIPRTPEEVAAFWAEIDALRGEDYWELPPRIELRKIDWDR
jgi:antitoxin VapB